MSMSFAPVNRGARTWTINMLQQYADECARTFGHHLWKRQDGDKANRILLILKLFKMRALTRSDILWGQGKEIPERKSRAKDFSCGFWLRCDQTGLDTSVHLAHFVHAYDGETRWLGTTSAVLRTGSQADYHYFRGWMHSIVPMIAVLVRCG